MTLVQKCIFPLLIKLPIMLDHSLWLCSPALKGFVGKTVGCLSRDVMLGRNTCFHPPANLLISCWAVSQKCAADYLAAKHRIKVYIISQRIVGFSPVLLEMSLNYCMVRNHGVCAAHLIRITLQSWCNMTSASALSIIWEEFSSSKISNCENDFAFIEHVFLLS